MAKGNEILLKLKAENKQLKAKLKDTEKGINRMEKSTKRSFRGMMKSSLAFIAVLAGSVIALKKIVSAASKLEETTSKFNTVFGTSEKVLKKANEAVDELRENYAMSEREAREYMAAMQDLLVPMGMAADKAGDMSAEIVKLAADLASFNDMPTSEVMSGIQSALVGNFETMKRYGVVLNETKVQQEAMNLKLWDGKGKIDSVAKSQAAYNLILKGTKAAQGDMIRTSDSYANVLKKLQSAGEDIAADLGKDLLPSLKNLFNEFIIASRGGGILTDALKGLVKGVSAVVTGLTLLVQALEYAKTKMDDHKTKVIQSGAAYDRARKRAKEYMIMLQQYTGSQKNAISILKQRAKYDKTAAVFLRNYKKIHSDLIQTGERKLNIDGKSNDILQRMNQTLKDYNDIGKKTIDGAIKNAQIFAEQERTKQEELEKTKESGLKTEEEKEAEEEEAKRTEEIYGRLFEMKKYYNDLERSLVAGTLKAGETALNGFERANKNALYEIMFGEGGWKEWQKNMSAILKQLIVDLTYAIIKALALKAVMASISGGGGFFLEAGTVPKFQKGHIPVLQSGDIPSDHYPALIGTREAVINAESTRANEGLLRAINENPGASFEEGSTTIHTHLDIDGKEIADIIDEHRNDIARRQGAQNYGRSSLYR